ncbi:hypothetical protein EP331_02420 [bacterium]|nr:MAG: hypothetical protein EP331_02420 [bacterium]
MLFTTDSILAQSHKSETKISASTVFLKSLVLPGWGHFSLSPEHHTRGYIHLGTEIGLMLSYFGIDASTQRLQQNMYAHVELYAGTSIQNRDRGYALALTRYENLSAYNEYQERSRNWNAFIADTPSNRWQWESVDAREDYIRMRNKIDANNQQLPFIVTVMVANRIISGISAFIRAREMNQTASATLSSISVSPVQQFGTVNGLQMNYSIRF